MAKRDLVIGRDDVRVLGILDLIKAFTNNGEAIQGFGGKLGVGLIGAKTKNHGDADSQNGG